MANQVEVMLTDELFQFLQEERFVTIATVDHETGGPNVSAISWVYAPNKETIFFAVDNRSRIIENIKADSQVVLNVIANESTYSLSGTGIVNVENLADVPLKLAAVELKLKEVRDVMFYGSKITTRPEYVKTYDKEAANKLDHQVMSAMKKI
ncbi:pyridoxamine 5'-phosphate oxidase family protein [Bacillaceae bacterium IKA-2]|nr:pyridoxamine 5'-phosphate oxidase family protein [Bacillaceae bacterium IKA-2]